MDGRRVKSLRLHAPPEPESESESGRRPGDSRVLTERTW